MLRGLVVGKFAPPHQGHQYLLETALAECDHVVVLVYSNPDFAHMPSSRRAAWLQALYPQASIFVPPSAPPNHAPDAVQREFVREFLAQNGLRVNRVYTSESYGPGFAAHLGVEHRLVDEQRLRFAVSGTLVRQNPHTAQKWLDPRIYRHFVQKVVLLGAESTGKSTLSQLLAQRYQTLWVPEYGRTLWELRQGHLGAKEFVEIAQHQRQLEEQALLSPQVNRYLFCDTNALTTAVFAHIYLRDCPNEVWRLAQECTERYEHVLVCSDDFGFVQDGTRSSREAQKVHQAWILHDLKQRGIGYTLLHGSLEQRLQQAIAALEQQQRAGESSPANRA